VWRLSARSLGRVLRLHRRRYPPSAHRLSSRATTQYDLSDELSIPEALERRTDTVHGDIDVFVDLRRCELLFRALHEKPLRLFSGRGV
jgi:hypothetical protein